MSKCLNIYLLAIAILFQRTLSANGSNDTTVATDDHIENFDTSTIYIDAIKLSKDFEPLSEHDKLLLSMLKEFSALAYETLIKSKGVLSEVLKDEKLLNATTKETEAVLQNISDLVQVIVKFENTIVQPTIRMEILYATSKIFWFRKLHDMLQKYGNSTPESIQLTEDEILIKKTLESHGYNELQNNFSSKFSTLAEKLSKMIQDYIDQLSEEQKMNDESELIKLFGKFKLEQDVQKKFVLFGKFFNLK